MAKTDIKYLSPVDVELKNQNKYCRFKKMGINHIDYNAFLKRTRKDFTKENYWQLFKVPKKISCISKKSKTNCTFTICS